MTIDQIDRLTIAISRVFDILLMKYPTRTGLGLVLGSCLTVAVQLFEPGLSVIKSMNFKVVPWYGWLPVGLFTMHIPTVISTFRQKSIGNDPIDQAMELIERGNFSAAEKRRQYRMLVEKVANDAVLKQEFQRELKNVEQSLAAESNRP
jgi:hypothetical protein